MSTVRDPPADPGATPAAARALAPDLARGGMLLLIALANVHVYVYGAPLGVRSYPRELSAVDQVVAVLQLLLVDGRAYPLFGLLFGYGIVQLVRRRAEIGMPVQAAVQLVRRRGGWMVAIGFTHALLLWAGDIVGAYGLLAVLLAGLLVTGSDRALLWTAAAGTSLCALVMTAAALPAPGTTPLPSMAIESPVRAAAIRLVEWTGIGLVFSSLTVFGAVALGAWAARRRILDDPDRHRRLLAGAAAIGLPLAVLGGLPLALMAAAGRDPGLGWLLLAGALHGVSGYAGAVGYAGLFGLLAIRLQRASGPARNRPTESPGSRGSAPSEAPGGFTGALRACGQRSLSCYLAQSVAFAALLPAWTLGLGENLPLWRAALVGLGTWAVILIVAAWSARAGYRGPAEVLLRRLTYGRRRATEISSPN